MADLPCHMAAVLVLALIPAVVSSSLADSKPMEGLSCRSVGQNQQLCTGKNEEYAIGFFNVRQIARSKYRHQKKPNGKECNSTCVSNRERLLPTLMHDIYGRPRFIFQDEENNLTQSVQLVSCSATCNNSTTCTTTTGKFDFVSWDPFYNYFDPQIVAFQIPTCCQCEEKSATTKE